MKSTDVVSYSTPNSHFLESQKFDNVEFKHRIDEGAGRHHHYRVTTDHTVRRETRIKSRLSLELLGQSYGKTEPWNM
jgi:hypothetical protein